MGALFEAIRERRRVSFLVQRLTLAEFRAVNAALNVAHIMAHRAA